MRNIKLPIVLFFLLVISGACQKKKPRAYTSLASAPQILHTSSEHLTDVIVFDIFKPPVASRIYAYTYLAAYEVLRNQYPQYSSLASKLNGFEHVALPDKGKEHCFPLASIHAFLTVGKTLTFSQDKWVKLEKEVYEQYQEMDIPDEVYKRSIEYGEKVAKHVLAYANKDNYKQTRGYRHTLAYKPGSWEPTPPVYAEACEPTWNSIRSFTLDSASQFAPPRPVGYDLDEKSEFYKLTYQVYTIGKNLTVEQRAIAYFWDDNAFVTNLKGHATFAEKKMTPPGHWVAIVRTVAKDKNLSMMQSLEAYTLSSIALYDAFIACWDEKYKSDRVRPITVINKYIDPNWEPFLETPAFPEYVSGHSSISAAAGRILIHLFGDNVAFTDSTEYKYGHGVRSFKSFSECYWETSMSRVYGGIHFRDGVEEGTKQGEKIGDWIWEKLKATPIQTKQESVIAEN